MTYELSTHYHYNLPLTDEQFAAAFGTQLDAGADSATAWLGMTGPFTGLVAMTSRWQSLDAMAEWSKAIAELIAAGGQFHEQSRANPMVSRFVSRIDVSIGSDDAAFALVTRGSRTSVPAGIDLATAEASMRYGVDGCRGSSLLLAGEWSGQVIGQFYSDSGDALVNLPARIQSDTAVMDLAKQAELTVLSRTLFRRLASTS